MDARYMDEFENGTFDAVIDKGTIDSLLCGEAATWNVNKTVSEVHRVLKENTGVYLVVSYG